jgi:hypothetical protein
VPCDAEGDAAREQQRAGGAFDDRWGGGSSIDDRRGSDGGGGFDIRGGSNGGYDGATVAVAAISVEGATAVTVATMAVAGLRCGAEMLEVRRYAYMSFIRDFTYFTSGGLV